MIGQISRDRSIDGLVRVGMAEVREIREAPSAMDRLGREINDLCEALLGELAGLTPAEMDRLHAARALYHRFGVDPTRTRPSPEAMLRRVLKGKAFPRILLPVDLANLWALASGLPVGLYDASKIEGPPIVLRRGEAGESYAGIRKPDVHLEGRLVLADSRGPFGNPSADSLRTSVDEESRHLLFVLFAPGDHPAEEMKRQMRWLSARIERYLESAPTTTILT